MPASAVLRALQEDAGLGALYFAVGFLEWCEQDDSTDSAYAPLVLVPASLAWIAQDHPLVWDSVSVLSAIGLVHYLVWDPY